VRAGAAVGGRPAGAGRHGVDRDRGARPAGQRRARAPVILHGARIRTLSGRPFASALAVVDGRFAYVGDDLTAARRAAGGEEIDLRGLHVTPGLADAHTHLAHW